MERCERYTQLLSARMDGELAPQERQELENIWPYGPECGRWRAAGGAACLYAGHGGCACSPGFCPGCYGSDSRAGAEAQSNSPVPPAPDSGAGRAGRLCAAVHWPIPDWNVQRRGRRTAHCGCRCQHAGSGPIPGGIFCGRGVRTPALRPLVRTAALQSGLPVWKRTMLARERTGPEAPRTPGAPSRREKQKYTPPQWKRKLSPPAGKQGTAEIIRKSLV